MTTKTSSDLIEYGSSDRKAPPVTIPRRALKIFKRTFGIKDQAAVVSITAGDDVQEPETQVLGFNQPSDVSVYADRDHVGLFIQNIGAPALVTTANTTFTNTSVTSPDFASLIAARQIAAGTFIDTNETPKKTGEVVSVNPVTNAITVKAWYVVDGSRATATPANGTKVFVNPSTKIWAINANVLLLADSMASDAVGIELGLINQKGDGVGYLYDAVNLSAFKGFAGHQVRGPWVHGFVAFDGCDYAFVANTAKSIAFYDKNSANGFQSDNAKNAAFTAKNAAEALLVKASDDSTISFIDGLGVQGRQKIAYGSFAHNTTIGDYTVVCSSVPITDGINHVINLPAPSGKNVERTLYLKNPMGGNGNALFAGLVEGASGSISVAPSKCVQVVSDGSQWIPIGSY